MKDSRSAPRATHAQSETAKPPLRSVQRGHCAVWDPSDGTTRSDCWARLSKQLRHERHLRANVASRNRCKGALRTDPE